MKYMVNSVKLVYLLTMLVDLPTKIVVLSADLLTELMVVSADLQPLVSNQAHGAKS